MKTDRSRLKKSLFSQFFLLLCLPPFFLPLYSWEIKFLLLEYLPRNFVAQEEKSLLSLSLSLTYTLFLPLSLYFVSLTHFLSLPPKHTHTHTHMYSQTHTLYVFQFLVAKTEALCWRVFVHKESLPVFLSPSFEY